MRCTWWACLAGGGARGYDAYAVLADPDGGWRLLLRPVPIELLLTEAAVALVDAPSLPVPVGLDPALATLTVPLARARARADALGEVGEIVLDGYDLDHALLHAELLRRTAVRGNRALEVRVLEAGTVRASAARALGARVEPAAGGAPRSAGEWRDDATADTATRAAVDVLAGQSWRFQPLLTGGMTLAELRQTDPAGIAEHVGLVVAA